MKTVAVIVQDGFAPFEFGVACEAFGLDRSDDGIPNFDFRIVTPRPGVVKSKMGFSINVDNDLSFAYEADLVVVSPTPREYWSRTDERVLDVVRQAVARDVLYVQHGRIITSAGTAAGLDACLHLLRQELGAELTNKIARRMVVPPQRDGGQAQFIDKPLPEVASLSLAPVTDWMLENLRLELTVDQLASKAHMSPRTFARRFKADFGATPAAWLARQRIIHAQRLLEKTDLGLDRIAYESGFGSAAVLRQNFARVLATTPTAYRARFACTLDAMEAVGAETAMLQPVA